MTPKRIRLKIKEIEVRPLRLPRAQPRRAPEALKPAVEPQRAAAQAAPVTGEAPRQGAGAGSPRPDARNKRTLLALASGAALLGLMALWWVSPFTSQSPAPVPVPVSGNERSAAVTDRPVINPVNTLWVLAIGINDYGSSTLNLEFADHDAQQIVEMLRRQQPRLFRKVEAICLVNEKADRESILTAAERIAHRTHPDDVVFIFVAGHGILDKVQKEYYFLPHGANPENYFTKGLRWSEFSGIVKILSARVKNLVLAVDTCHSGAAARADLASEIKIDSGYVLSASKASEVSIEDRTFRLPREKRGHGVFTYALLRGLAGEADLNRDGLIKVEELFEYIARIIPELTKGRQHPYRVVSGTETIIIAARE